MRADLVPKGRQFASRGEDVLAAYRMEAIDQNGNILDPRQINWYGDEVYGYRYRQKPWEENSLGFVKIDFPNKDAVYIHDTPLKSLFGKAVRFESHGCVRTHNVDRLAAWVLDNNSAWSLARVDSMKHNSIQENVTVTQTIGVYFTYISAWATPRRHGAIPPRRLWPRYARDIRVELLADRLGDDLRPFRDRRDSLLMRVSQAAETRSAVRAANPANREQGLAGHRIPRQQSRVDFNISNN